MGRGWAFGAILDVKLDAVAFAEAAEAIALDGGMVDKDIFATLDGQEAKALLIAKPLDSADSTLLTHCWKLLRCCNGFQILQTKIKVQNVVVPPMEKKDRPDLVESGRWL
jgi:hypothetical protein